MRLRTCARAAAAETGRHGTRRRFAAAALLAALACAPLAHADRQMDPELRAIVQQAVAESRCELDGSHFEIEVFLKLQEPRLARFVRDAALRADILQNIFCHTRAIVRRYREQHQIELKLTPELVLAVMDVESRFDRYAVSSAGAVGLMQVMPFWPRQLGVENRLFGSVEFNVRVGCEILGFYMLRERNDYRRALARYNGSPGRREYPDLVLTRLTSRWRG